MSCKFSLVLGVKRVSAKFVPKFLNFDQNCRMTITQELLNYVSDDHDLLKSVIIGDESWVHKRLMK